MKVRSVQKRIQINKQCSNDYGKSRWVNLYVDWKERTKIEQDDEKSLDAFFVEAAKKFSPKTFNSGLSYINSWLRENGIDIGPCWLLKSRIKNLSKGPSETSSRKKRKSDLDSNDIENDSSNPCHKNVPKSQSDCNGDQTALPEFLELDSNSGSGSGKRRKSSLNVQHITNHSDKQDFTTIHPEPPCLDDEGSTKRDSSKSSGQIFKPKDAKDFLSLKFDDFFCQSARSSSNQSPSSAFSTDELVLYKTIFILVCDSISYLIKIGYLDTLGCGRNHRIEMG
jgi:hypothetical protein